MTMLSPQRVTLSTHNASTLNELTNTRAERIPP